jgi:hypothetical protein
MQLSARSNQRAIGVITVNVYFLTIVKDGRVTLTSILATSYSTASIDAYAVFKDMLSNAAWDITSVITDQEVIVWANKEANFKATLIKA